MDSKFLVNQRVRELMAALNFPENVDGFYKKFIGDSSSERLRLVFNDRHPIKIEFLLEIAKNIGEKANKKVNGHWLLTGEGEMFLPEKGTYILNTAGSDDYLIKNALTSIVNKEREIEQLKADLKAEKEKNSSMDKTSLPDSNKK